jgi:hypothetical protein
MDDPYLDVFIFQFFQGLGQRFYRTLHIALDDQIQFLDLALLNLAEKLLGVTLEFLP